MDTIENIIDEMNSRFSSELWLDFEVLHLQNGQLRVLASTDFSYYHLMEVDFGSICYFHGPLRWGSTPAEKRTITRLDADVSRSMVEKYKLDDANLIVRFDSSDDFDVIIASSEICVNYDVVYYYHREGLGPNERIDPRFLNSPGI